MNSHEGGALDDLAPAAPPRPFIRMARDAGKDA
jgi:hypothetical protein